jgi:hypothetical protein
VTAFSTIFFCLKLAFHGRITHSWLHREYKLLVYPDSEKNRIKLKRNKSIPLSSHVDPFQTISHLTLMNDTIAYFQATKLGERSLLQQ